MLRLFHRKLFWDVFNLKLRMTSENECPNECHYFEGLHSTVDSILASHPAASGLNPSIPKKFSEEILKLLRLINGTYLNSGQRLDYTYLVWLVAS